jgi:hypothetical protein
MSPEVSKITPEPSPLDVSIRTIDGDTPLTTSVKLACVPATEPVGLAPEDDDGDAEPIGLVHARHPIAATQTSIKARRRLLTFGKGI